MKPVITPIPVDAELESLIREGAKATGLKKADIMRQGLRWGVPAFVQRLRQTSQRTPPACLAYLDDYPSASIEAKDYKSALKTKLARKYARPNR